MRYFRRRITKRGTVRFSNDEWYAERWGSLLQERQAGDPVFVYIEHWGAVPLLLNTDNPPDAYGNEICRLERSS